MTIERFKTISDIVAAWFGLVAIVAGGIFAIVQYLEKEKGDRVKNSLDLLARFNDRHVVDARGKIFEIWNRRETDLIAAAEKSALTPNAYNDFVLSTMVAEGAYPSFTTLVDFYELVHICVAESVCDKSVATALFQPDARTFFLLHYPAIEQMRIKRKDLSYGLHLQGFALSK